jgi:transcriptional regulator with XRE-family HTH domain
MLEVTRQREAAGWTRMELGRRARLHPARVGQIENGRVHPPANSVELKRLARTLCFKGDPNDLLKEVES